LEFDKSLEWLLTGEYRTKGQDLEESGLAQ
jgi:hypothetical protein